MHELELFFSKFPAWAGSVPMWGVFAMVLIALIRVWPRLRELSIQERANVRDPYLRRIAELAADVKDCRESCEKQEKELREEIAQNKRECDDRETRLKDEIDSLKTKINNEAWQRVQSEISLVNTLVQVLPSAELKLILDALQKRSALMPATVTALGGPVDDVKGTESGD
jgi:biopolymer transport protein ExbB/TolQ